MRKFVSIAAIAIAFGTSSIANARAYVQVQSGLDSISVEGESDEGLAFGIAAGYDLPISSAIFAGIEASFDDSTTKECASDVLISGDRACVKTGRDLSAVVRLGANLNDSNQLYVLGGYTNARFKATYNDGTSSESAGENVDGFRVGAGFKHNFGESFFGKVEYRYSNYESDISRHNALIALGLNF